MRQLKVWQGRNSLWFCGPVSCVPIWVAMFLVLLWMSFPALFPAVALSVPVASAQVDNAVDNGAGAPADLDTSPSAEGELGRGDEAIGWMNTPGVSPNEVNEVARDIWCPLCSGVRLDSCELLACQQMKDVIALKLAEGENSEQIKNYFLEQYGPQILGEPPREGFNWLAWILPVVALTGGGAFLWRQTRRLVRPSDEPGDSGQYDAGQPQGVEENVQDARLTATGETASESTASARTDSRTEAERRLDEELAKYG